MKILVVNSISKQEYEIEVASESSTFFEVKMALQSKYSINFPQISPNFLYNGKLISEGDDQKSLSSLGIKEGSKILMNFNNDSKNKNKPLISEDVEQKVKTKYQNQLNTLIEMGFEREKAIACINAARGRTEIAIEYYYNDIPNLIGGEEEQEEEEEEEESSDENNNNQNNNQQNNENALDFNLLLKKSAGIIKIICREKNMSPNQVINLIQNKNYLLFQIIQQNQDAFKNYFSRPISKTDMEAFNEFKSGKTNPYTQAYNLKYSDFFNSNDENNAEEEEESEGEEEDLNINDNDKEVLKRLKELGDFKEEEVIQAYLTCGKNEELTADFLFEKNEDQQQKDDGGAHPLDLDD